MTICDNGVSLGTFYMNFCRYLEIYRFLPFNTLKPIQEKHFAIFSHTMKRRRCLQHRLNPIKCAIHV